MRPHQTAEDRLRALAAGQLPVLEHLAQMQVDNLQRSRLDEETYTLVRLSALVASGADPVAYLAHLHPGRAGIPNEQILGTLMAIAPLVGSARLLSAASRLASAGFITAEAGHEQADHG